MPRAQTNNARPVSPLDGRMSTLYSEVMENIDWFADGRALVRTVPRLVSTWERQEHRRLLREEAQAARKEAGVRRAWALGVLWELRR